jgi:hypothetical protein
MRPAPADRPGLTASGATLLLTLLLCGLPALAQSGRHPWAWSVHDTDGDGYLSPDEYWVLLEVRRTRHSRYRGIAPQPAPAFEEVDRNGDGGIDEDELTDALQHNMYRYRHGGPPWR